MNFFQLMIILESIVMLGLTIICSVCFYKLGRIDERKNHNENLMCNNDKKTRLQ